MTRTRSGHRLASGAAGLALAVLLTACSSSPRSAHSTTTTTAAPSTTTAAPATTTTPTTTASEADASVTWLCRPGTADDPCLSDLDTTAVGAGGRKHVVAAAPSVSPKIDCFYVYPTVSTQKTANANLTVDPEETAVAKAQASRFSQACDVYAPMYRQLTLAGITGLVPVTAADRDLAYADVLAAWKYYLAHYNHGRGVAFIGHSQGSAMLIDLLKSQIDPDPIMRSRMVSAILLGGNVTVADGQTLNGTFQHIPICTDVGRPGCIIAYSSFAQAPPANSIFGRVSSPINALSGENPIGQLHVACVNPVAGTTGPAGTTGTPGTLTPYFPTSAFPDPGGTSSRRGTQTSAITTPWVTYPRLYQAQCMSEGGATWLQVNDIAGPNDNRPVVQQTLGPAWGLHLVDVNIALGNLVSDLQRQADRY